MMLSHGEKLILLMLADLYRKLGINGEIDPAFIKTAIVGGQIWTLDIKYGDMLSDDGPSPEVTREVGAILQMWSFVETSFKHLDAAGRAAAASGWQCGKKVEFPGFDGNKEGDHHSAALAYVEVLGKFTEFKDREMNSHWPTVAANRWMLETYRSLPSSSQFLSAGDIACLLRSYSEAT